MAPRYGSRLLPVVVDEIAQSRPLLPYASVALNTDVNEGFKTLTFSDIAAATNNLAAWIHRSFGRSSHFDTIAYMGPGDIRYVVVFLAAVKCGYKVLLPSLRNSPWMNTSLFEQTQCCRLLYASEVEALIKPLLQQKADLQGHQIQALENLIVPEEEQYPFEKDYNTAKWDPILVLHSSGSTGPPRPIQMNHATFAVGDNDRNLPSVPGRVNQNWALWDFPEKETFYSPFPAFHLAGFSSMVMLPIYYSNATLVLGPPSRPPTGHLVSEIMNHFKLKSIFCPPIIAEQLVQELGGIQKCQHLKFLLYAGGPLSQTAGDALSKVTDVCQFYGQTETGAIQALVPKREDWASLEWHPMQEAIMEPSIEATYEMVMKRNPALEGIRSVSCNFPDVEVWRTRDLFKPHPTKPNLWRFYGRADDIIILSNGEKFNPVPSETQIAAHPLLAGALIVGQGYAQASLILEPQSYPQDLEALVNELWPTIEKANAEAPGHAKITRNMILASQPDKPFDRAAKGTVIRGPTGKKYERDISELYTRENMRHLEHITLDASPDLEATIQFVKAIVASSSLKNELGPNDDLFVLGLDSLQTTQIVLLLKAGIKSCDDKADLSWISAKLVYEHPSITALSEAILRRLNSEAMISVPMDESPTQDRVAKMISMVEWYTENLPVLEYNEGLQPSEFHVILTGSTGSLGTQILLNLLSDPKVTRIHCLDRSSTARNRITGALEAWRTPQELDAGRVSFYQADYGKPAFGLSAQTFRGLQAAANIIIHNAWKVDFNHSLESFETIHIRGVRHLVDFAATSTFRPRVIFISSISSVGNWSAASRPRQGDNSITPVLVPERIPETPAVALPMGYAESKAVAEQILARAASRGVITATILRVGQIAGPLGERNGIVWNEHEWFPLMLKTAKRMGKIPNGKALEDLNWVPVDVLASVIGKITTSTDEHAKRLNVLHLVNPVTKPWSELLPRIRDRLVAEEVSMSDWIKELEGVDDAKVDEFPAVKILDFFSAMKETGYAGGHVMPETSEAKKQSPALGDLGPVREEWVEKWMDGWGL